MQKLRAKNLRSVLICFLLTATFHDADSTLPSPHCKSRDGLDNFILRTTISSIQSICLIRMTGGISCNIYADLRRPPVADLKAPRAGAS
ncbi:MAG: hypothetical protein DKT66_10350 [Candidatus Melainabacteria bacterium]|nr:MAG: hypothetical protein DKT66_10350 [Candidatus Melainabacteria bacterium]